MSGLSAAHPRRRPGSEGRVRRLAMWLGHYHPLVLLAAVMLGIGSDLLGRQLPALEAVSSAAFIAWVVAFAAEILCHQRQLCERCISEAPTLNPEGAVKRWRRALWGFHQQGMNAILMLAVVGWFIAGGTMGHWHAWQYAVDALGLLVLGYVYFIGYIHRRLYPWCPWCRWDDDGDEEVSPPVPEVPAVR